MSVTHSGSGAGAAYDSGALTTTITGPTIPSGANRYLFVSVGGWDGTNTGTPTVTFGGASMTQLIHEQGSSQQHLQLFGYIAPAVGSGNDIVVTFPATTWHVGITWDVYLGVSQSTPAATAVSGFGNISGPGDVNVSGLSADDLIAGALIEWTFPVANYTPLTGVTQRHVGDNSAGDGEVVFSADRAVTVGSNNNQFGYSWTGGTSVYSVAAVELQVAGGVAVTGSGGTGSPGNPGNARSVALMS